MPPPTFNDKTTWRKQTLRSIRLLRLACQLIGLPALVVAQGFEKPPNPLASLFDPLFLVLALVFTVLPLLQWWLSLTRSSYLRGQGLRLLVVGVTVLGVLVLLVIPPAPLYLLTGLDNSEDALQAWCRLTVLIWSLLGLLSLFRRVSLAGWNPAAVLVLSFLSLNACGTLLLMLPRARADGQGGAFWDALFTSTSATCVTGLVVVDTGTHWSRSGQVVILVLIQIGGLGIMTFGAFFALVVGRGLVVRETVLLGDLLERKVLQDIRRLVIAILAFTLISELIGAALLSTLWPDLPPGERIFQSVFHSVSAFCNAGFALTANSFEDSAFRWQIWGVLSSLIIVGGIGFVALYNLYEVTARRLARERPHPLFHLPRARSRLSLSTRLALATSVILLLMGMLGFLLLESRGSFAELSSLEQLAAAWFQSVTCRTAGFNTVNIGQLSEAAKFFAIFLMVIGASPGSTGGGLKTVPFAIIVLSLRSMLRGRRRVEIGHRTIPEFQVGRALLMASVGVALMSIMTLLVVAFENRPGYFLDYFFEVVSALATVGLSTGVTADLSLPSRCVLIVAMFLGRVGPLTLIVALAGGAPPDRYNYPDERVLLG